ncbi:MAG: translesion error-prone DNA polymerase V autoproteolytic subunit [Spirochaetales bacterium]|jgi:DNA polymerase V|nr:translesion error-prone DNA polymerase V autoproteolytic subunit [Spirochaetales bacterium]
MPQATSSISAIYGFAQKQKLKHPLFSSGVSAGFPSPAEDYIEQRLDLNELLIQHPAATFFVRVNGDSMTGAGIQHNDILIVDRSIEATSGKIVIAIVGGEFTVKRLLKKGASCQLIAENPNYPAITITEDSDCEVWGVVTASINQF